VPLTMKRELQQLIGKINFVRRFISNLSGRIEPFMDLVKIKVDEEFHWGGGAEQQRAFEEIKEYLARLPVLVPSQQDRPFYIYLSIGDTSIASVVVHVYDDKEKVVFYLSRRMLDTETRDNRYLQVGRHQAYAVSSCVERPTQEVDVRTVRFQYSVSAHEGSQGTSIGRPHRRKN
jgi:hypothetical protein